MAGSTNVFALLGDGDDDIQTLAAKAPVAVKAPVEAPAPVKRPAGPAKDVAPAGAPDGGRGGRGGRGEGRGEGRGGRGGRGEGRGRGGDRPYGDRPAPRDQNGGAPEGLSSAAIDGPGGRGGRGDRPGRGRGGRGSPDMEGRPRREYERRDGTGRGHEGVKRGGAGVGNWGTEGEESKAVDSEPKEDAASPSPSPEGDAPAVEAVVEVPAEPEIEEMTMQEYEVLMAEKKAALNKAAEVKSISMEEFKGMKTFVRKETELNLEGLEITVKKAIKGANKEEVKEVKPVKKVVETGFRIAETSSEGGRGEGGRGRGRGGRGEGGGRGDRPFSGRGEGRGFGGRGGEGRVEGGGRGDRPFSGRGRGEGRGDGGRPAFSAGRGGRGGDAPRAGRGAGRGAEIAIEDTTAFPSLA